MQVYNCCQVVLCPVFHSLCKVELALSSYSDDVHSFFVYHESVTLSG